MNLASTSKMKTYFTAAFCHFTAALQALTNAA
jgi:hypothetical protein